MKPQRARCPDYREARERKARAADACVSLSRCQAALAVLVGTEHPKINMSVCWALHGGMPETVTHGLAAAHMGWNEDEGALRVHPDCNHFPCSAHASVLLTFFSVFASLKKYFHGADTVKGTLALGTWNFDCRLNAQ